MPRNSLKSLLDMFPWFFDKSETSNFYKSQDVTNKRFQELYNDLFKVHESFHLSKRLLIWKEQSEPYEYVIHFVANFPFLKNVTIYKNDTVIYSDSFEYVDEVNTFEYSYEDSTLNDVVDETLADIIPQDKFKIEVTTHEEYHFTKGWPEKDEPTYKTVDGKKIRIFDDFDHDISLDRIGKINNIPRKQYLIVNPSLYPSTEPPYNDRATEDDYHYMKRIIQYLLMIQTTPLPVAEIWKLYGINATMENREKLLLKVFDLEKHPNFIDNRTDENGNYISKGDRWFSGTLNEETGEITQWTPEKWEHMDKFCDYSSGLGEYFFVKASTKIPVKNQPVILSFKFLNMLAQPLTGDYTVDIVLDGRTLYSGITAPQLKLESNEIPQDKQNSFFVYGKNSNGDVIGVEEVIINVRGCNNADWYVSPSGNDSNNGKTRNTPFKTIQKAINSVNGDKNLIVLLGGTYEINRVIALNQSCTILGCGGVLIENLEENLFFTLPKNITLTLQDLTLQYRGDICDVTDTSFTNHNGDNSLLSVMILFTNAPILTTTLLVLDSFQSMYFASEPINLILFLRDKYGDGITGESVSLTINDGTTYTETTGVTGRVTKMITPTIRKDLVVNASYAGDSETYKPSTAILTIPYYIRLTKLLNDYDYVVMDMQYNRTSGEWVYETKEVSEITKLSDLNGAIMNLTYTDDMSVTYDRYASHDTSYNLNKTKINSLKGLLVGLAYENGDVEYMEISLFTSTTLTLNTNVTSCNVGGTVTYTGLLKDKYNNAVPGALVNVNNTLLTTNSSGEFTGTITTSVIGDLIINASFEGDTEYGSSNATKKVDVLISLASVLSDYDYVVMDMNYTDGDWLYETKEVSEITKLSDLNGAIMNLNKYNDDIQYERFSSTSNDENISKSQRQSLSGLLVGIEYDDYTVEYENLQIN